jgi:hypothetical protein
VQGVAGHLAYFTLLGIISASTVVVCVVGAARDGRIESRYLLPAAWALYNAVGPTLFLAAALVKRTRSLEMWVYALSTVGGCIQHMGAASAPRGCWNMGCRSMLCRSSGVLQCCGGFAQGWPDLPDIWE